MPSKLADYLDEHGPTPIDETPTVAVSTRDRVHGVTTFNISNSGPAVTAMGGAAGLQSVAYLFDVHSPEDVLRAFFRANSEWLEDTSRNAVQQMVGRHGQRYKAAVRVVLNEREFEVADRAGVTS